MPISNQTQATPRRQHMLPITLAATLACLLAYWLVPHTTKLVAPLLAVALWWQPLAERADTKPAYLLSGTWLVAAGLQTLLQATSPQPFSPFALLLDLALQTLPLLIASLAWQDPFANLGPTPAAQEAGTPC